MARKDININIKATDKGATRTAKAVSDSLNNLAKGASAIAGAGTKTGRGIAAITNEIDRLSTEGKNASKLGKLVEQIHKVGGEAAETKSKLAGATETFRELTKASGAAADRVKSLDDALTANQSAVQARANALEKVNRELKEQEGALKKAERAQRDFDKATYTKKFRNRDTGRDEVFARTTVLSADQMAKEIALQKEIAAARRAASATGIRANDLAAKNFTMGVAGRGLADQFKEAKGELKTYEADLKKAAKAVTDFTDKLNKQEVTLGSLRGDATEISRQLGGVAATEKGVAEATAKANAELEKQRRLVSTFDRLASKPLAGGGRISDPTPNELRLGKAAELQRAREDVVLLKSALVELEAAMRNAWRAGDGSAQQRIDDYNRMTKAVSLAEQEVRKLQIMEERANGRRAGGLGSTGFGAWSRGVDARAAASPAAAPAPSKFNYAEIKAQAERNAAAMGRLGSETDRVADALNRKSNASRNALSFMQRLRSEVLAMAMAYVGLYAAVNRVGEALQTQRKYEAAEVKLAVAFEGDTELAAQEMKWLEGEADRLAYTFGDLANAYGKISVAAQSAGFSIKDTRQLFTSITEAARVNGTSVDEMNGVLKAFEQMLSKGCHAPGSLIMMFDGSAKAVEKIAVGEQLMGPDGTPRTVEYLVSGREEMFQITPSVGHAFVVNAWHKMRLERDGEHVTISLRDLIEGGEIGAYSLIRGRDIYVPFTVKSVGIGPYHGFQISGDNLYLDAQCFQQHNSIQAEELRGQLGDRMTGAYKLFADALGLTTAELGEMMKQGEILADRDTLMKVAERLKKVYGAQLPKALTTTGFAIDMFARNGEKANKLIADGMGDAFLRASQAFSKFINSADGKKFFTDLGAAAGKCIEILMLIPQNMDLILTAGKALLGLGLAKVFTGLYGALSRSGAALTTHYNQLVAAAAAGKKLSGSQQHLLGTMVGFSDRMQYAADDAIRLGGGMDKASRATRAYAGVLRGFSNVLLGVTNLARGMWAAIGGAPGLLIAGASVAFMNWKTDADRATEALEEHERQIEAVRQAYIDAGDAAEKMTLKVVGVTVSQAAENLKALMKAADDARAKVTQQVSNMWIKGDLGTNLIESLTGGNAAMARAAEAVAKLDAEYKNGEITLQTYSDSLDDLYRQYDDPAVQTAIAKLQALIGEHKKVSEKVADQAAVTQKLGGNVEELTGYTGELSNAQSVLKQAIKDVSQTMENGGVAGANAFGEALDALKAKIPSLAEELQNLKNLQDINAAGMNAMKAAWANGDWGGMIKAGAYWGQAHLENSAAVAAKTDYSGFAAGRRGTAAGKTDEELVRAVMEISAQYNWKPEDLMGIFSYETGGTFNPWQKGPRTRQWGQHRGLAQWGEEQARTYGVHEGMSVADQVRAYARYALDRGVKPGDGLLPHYAAVNAGHASKIHASDANNGGDKGDVKWKVANRLPEHIAKGRALLELYSGAALEGTEAYETRQRAEEDGKREQERKDEDAAREKQRIADKAAAERAATQATLSDYDHKLSQQGLINAGKEREAAIEDALRSAKEANANITQQELAAVAAKAGALWDAQQATKATGDGMEHIRAAQEELNHLESQRTALVEQRTIAEEKGDTAKVQELTAKIEELNTKIATAADGLAAMWANAGGGAEADAAIAQLQLTKDQLTHNKTAANQADQAAGAFGLSMSTWQGVFQGGVQGIVGVFDGVAEAIANGENALHAFGAGVLKVFAQVLQQIAAAILQQQILNMMMGMGGGIGKMAGAMLGGGAFGHTGGLVGAMAIGSGNAIRRSAWAQSAFTYHTGGIAGLRPDEVSATLKVGEEVLTQDDPRHRRNLGGAKGGADAAPVRIEQTLAIGDREIANIGSSRAMGEAIVTHIRRNASTIRNLLG